MFVLPFFLAFLIFVLPFFSILNVCFTFPHKTWLLVTSSDHRYGVEKQIEMAWRIWTRQAEDEEDDRDGMMITMMMMMMITMMMMMMMMMMKIKMRIMKIIVMKMRMLMIGSIRVLRSAAANIALAQIFKCAQIWIFTMVQYNDEGWSWSSLSSSWLCQMFTFAVVVTQFLSRKCSPFGNQPDLKIWWSKKTGFLISAEFSERPKKGVAALTVSDICEWGNISSSCIIIIKIIIIIIMWVGEHFISSIIIIKITITITTTQQ